MVKISILVRSLASASILAWLSIAAPGAALTVQPEPWQDDWCRDDYHGDNDREQHCEVRQLSAAATGATLTVDARPNGGIRVRGSDRTDIAVWAKVTATARTREEARAIASRVTVTAIPDRVEADGPRDLGRREGWHVSYRLDVPRTTPLSLQSTNGGINIDNVRSEVRFRTVNGGVTLTRAGGDVEGRTTNGAVRVDLDGTTWDGGGLDVETSNGSVNLSIPAGYSARLETGTVNGRMQVDFPMTVQGTIGRSMTADLGSGGPLLRAKTSNGAVRIRRKD
jgi:hypothetical protein